MNHRMVLRVLASFCVGLMIAFLAAEVDAQRRGGGGRGGGGRGGGGGRSVHRSGPAMGGSMRPSRGGAGGGMRSRPTTASRPSAGTRPTTGAATRPATGAATTRPATGATRPGQGGTGVQQRPSQGTGAGAGQRPGQGESGTRGDKLQEAQGNRDANRDENREDWQNWSNDRQEDRQKWAHNEADDREDFYEENGGAYYYGGGWGYGGGHYTVIDDDHDDWVGVVAGLAIGSALTAAAFSSMQQSTACTMSEATVNGVRYYRCGNTWYTRVMDGSNINYVVVSPPVGY